MWRVIVKASLGTLVCACALDACTSMRHTRSIPATAAPPPSVVAEDSSASLVVNVTRDGSAVPFPTILIRRNADPRIELLREGLQGVPTDEIRSAANQVGVLTVRHLVPGFYFVRVAALGYETQQPDTVTLVSGSTGTVRHEVTGVAETVKY